MQDASALYRLLGDDARLRLLRVLDQDRFNVKELTGILGLAQSGVSRHLGLLKEAGMDAYPASTDRDTSNADFLDTFEEIESGGRQAVLAGRVLSRRGQGGIMFADLNDGTGKVQIVLQENEMDVEQFKLFTDAVDIGDFIETKGTAYTTKRGEKSLLARSWKMLAKSLSPIPDQWYGLKDEEKILRERYLDILLNPEVKAMFERRAKF